MVFVPTGTPRPLVQRASPSLLAWLEARAMEGQMGLGCASPLVLSALNNFPGRGHSPLLAYPQGQKAHSSRPPVPSLLSSV